MTKKEQEHLGGDDAHGGRRDLGTVAPDAAPHVAHTPGPWLTYYSAMFPPSMWVGIRGMNVARVLTGNRTKAEAEANAHLIAAAPELLDALLTLSRWCWDPTALPFDMKVGDIRAKVLAALEKAEGRSHG